MGGKGSAEWGRYERMRPADIERVRSRIPVAYLPWGALEWHSYHNPVGLDGMKAALLCEALAAETGGVVLPPVYVGTDTIKPLKGFPHTIEHSFDTVKRLHTEFLEQLADEQFKVIVVVAGHYGGGQVKAMAESAEAFALRRPDVRVWSFPDYHPLDGRWEPDHAGIGETSYQMLADSDTVDLSLVPEGRSPSLDEDGVVGADPKAASEAVGSERLAVFVANAAPRVLALLREVG